MNKKVIIIGAGMAGCFMAVCLAKRGYDIEIYEARPDVRIEPYDSGRSFNLTLYYRGIMAMKKMGMWENAKKVAVIAEGNVAHYSKEKTKYDPFDAKGNEILYTVHRNNLNAALIKTAESYENIKFFFNQKCIEIDKDSRTVSLQQTGSDNVKKVTADMVIGADGVNSFVRSKLNKAQKDTAIKEYEEWGYKEVHIPKELTALLNLRLQATHTWPRPDSLLIAFPNPDASFTLMFNLTLKGEKSFQTLISDELIELFIKKDFPDLLPARDLIIESFHNKPIGKFVTLHNDTWHDGTFMVLIGDAAHAVIPFYGQGMCAAFEDCLLLDSLIEKYSDDLPTIFATYQKERKKNTDILAELSKENFIELRDKSRSPYYVLKDKSDTLLHKLFPNLWQPPLYVSIAHTDMEYDKSINLYKRQERISKLVGFDFLLHAIAYPLEKLKRG